MKLFTDTIPRSELGPLYREIWRLAWPAFVGQGLNSAVSFVSRVIVGQLGERQFNTVNIGMMIFMLLITVVAAVGVGTTALVAQYWGAGDRKKAGQVLQQSLIFGFALCLLLALIGALFSEHIFRAMDTGGKSLDLETGGRFLFLLFIAMPLIATGFFFASALRGAGDTRTPMFAALVMGALTLIFSYGLILGRFGMPRLEALGAALAIDASFFAFSLILTLVFVFNKTELRLPARGWRPDFDLGFKIFRIGIPSATEWVLFQLGLLIYTKVVLYYGESAMAGYLFGLALIGLAQAPAFGFQAAAATLVGQNVGAKRFAQAESAFRHCVLLGLVFMTVSGLFLQLFSLPGAMRFLFPELTPASLGFARTFNFLLLISMPLMGVAFTMAGGLRGAGDTILPLIGSAVGMYIGRLLLAFLLYFLFKPHIIIIWCTMYPDMILRIAIMTVRVASGKWKRGRIKKE